MDSLPFAAAVGVILATPGPTNTLLAAAGARAGLRASLSLVPAELCGYGLTIALWGVGLEPATAVAPWLPLALRLGCVAYLVVLALALWRRAGNAAAAAPSSPGRVFLATLLNPKALLFSVAVFPPAAFRDVSAYATSMAIFAAVLVPIAVLWIALGSRVSGAGQSRGRLVERIAAIVLGGFSVTLAATTFG